MNTLRTSRSVHGPPDVVLSSFSGDGRPKGEKFENQSMCHTTQPYLGGVMGSDCSFGGSLTLEIWFDIILEPRPHLLLNGEVQLQTYVKP